MIWLLDFINGRDIIRLSDHRWYRRMKGGIWIQVWIWRLGEAGYYAWGNPGDTPPRGWNANPPRRTEDYATIRPAVAA